MFKFLLVLFSFILFSCSGGVSTEYRSAKTYVSNQDYEKAEEQCLTGIKNNPEDALTPYYLALNIYGAPNSPKKDYNKTAEYFQIALEMDQKDDELQNLPEPLPVYNKDNQEILLTTIQDAINHYSYAIWAEVFNSSIELIQQNKNDEAIKKLELATIIAPSNALSYDMMARLYFENEKYILAQKNANKAINLDKNLTDIYTIKAEVSKQNGDNNSAEEFLKQAYDLAIKNNESPEKLTNHMAALFDILFLNDKKSEALNLSEALIENDPENVLLYSNAGALYQNILLDQQGKANSSLSKIDTLNEQQLEDLKLIYKDCIELAGKARENFLMCNQFELDEIKAEQYYSEAKRLKQIVNELKSYIRKIDKKINEL